MKNTTLALAAMLAFTACTDNASSDNSQDNTSTNRPSQDSSSPSIENTGATNPNTVESVGNQGAGADSDKGTGRHSDSVMNGSAISQDTVVHDKPKK